VATVRFNNLDGTPDSFQSGSRQSAYYLRDKKQVYISDQIPAETVSSLPQLELHESLGALGYDDHTYALSTSLTTLSNMGPTQQRDRLQQVTVAVSFVKTISKPATVAPVFPVAEI
jgi:hypothetical protein